MSGERGGRETAGPPEAGKVAPSAGVPVRPAAPPNGFEFVWAAVLFSLALGLRLLIRNPESLWLDEANSVLIARRSLGGILSALREDGNPPLYYFLLHFWSKAAGDGEPSLRLFSSILGATFPPVLYLAARRLYGRLPALTAAGLALCWPVHVFYSQQVRMYALLPTFSTAFVSALLAALENVSGKRWWFLLIASAIALLYTHNYGLFVVAAAPLAWWVHGPRTRAVALRLCCCLALVFAAYSPWLLTVVAQARSDVGWWIGQSFRPDAPLRSLLLFGPSAPLPLSAESTSRFPPLWALSFVWLAASLGLGLGSRARPPDGQRKGARDVGRGALAGSLIVLLAVPILVPYLVSLAGKPIYYTGRYEIVAYPAWALLLGLSAASSLERGSARRGRLFIWGALLMLYAALAGASLERYRFREPERSEDRIAGSLRQWASPGDLVIFTGLGRAPVEYYLSAPSGPAGLRLLSYPAETGRHLGWYDFAAARRPGAMEKEAEELVEGLAGFPGKVFLVDHNGFPQLYKLQEPLRRLLLSGSKRHRTLLRTGPDPQLLPLYEVSVYAFTS